MAVMLKPSATASWRWLIGNTDKDVTSTILIVAATLFVFWLVWKSTSKKSRHPPLPPGPPAWPIVGNLLSLDPELHSYFLSLAKLYGPILTLRLGKKVGIVITSPALAREVLKINDTTFANHDVMAAASEGTYGCKDMVWSPYGDQWRMLRKICVGKLLSTQTLDSVSFLRQKEIRNTIKHLYNRVGSPVKVGEQMFLTLWNVITGMMWGGSVKAEDGESLGTEFKQIVHDITGYLSVPNLSDFYPGLARFDLQGIRKKMKVLAKRFDVIFEKMIDERRKKMGEDGNKDFLQFLLEVEDDGDSKTPFTITHLKALFMDLVVGGTDTTSNTLEFALAELMSKPKTLKKAQQELDRVVGKYNIVNESHIIKLPYLRGIMKEVLRLHPTLPLLVPRCPSESCVVGGYTVPKGARVFFNAWAIHRDPDIWDNPLEFRPERFLDSKLDYSGNDYSYIPFGSGRRICVGITVAEKTFVLLLASLLHSFNWELAQGEKLDTSEMFGIVLKMKVPLIAIPTPRLSDPTLYE